MAAALARSTPSRSQPGAPRGRLSAGQHGRLPECLHKRLRSCYSNWAPPLGTPDTSFVQMQVGGVSSEPPPSLPTGQRVSHTQQRKVGRGRVGDEHACELLCRFAPSHATIAPDCSWVGLSAGRSEEARRGAPACWPAASRTHTPGRQMCLCGGPPLLRWRPHPSQELFCLVGRRPARLGWSPGSVQGFLSSPGFVFPLRASWPPRPSCLTRLRTGLRVWASQRGAFPGLAGPDLLR